MSQMALKHEKHQLMERATIIIFFTIKLTVIIFETMRRKQTQQKYYALIPNKSYYFEQFAISVFQCI